MAEVRPLRALHYDLAAVPSLGDVTAPPYDVIDADLRRELLERSPFNVVEIDLPQAPEGEDPYEHAGETLEEWTLEGILTADREDAIWPMTQEYTAPDGSRRTRHGILARVRVTDYGPGKVRPHERTQPGPKEDRLRLTRATRHNMSPIFSLYAGDAWGAVEEATAGEPWGEVTDDDGTVHRVWRVSRPRGARGRDRGARGLRAADRRRPSPLRDRAHLRRRDRRRGAAPLHADVPRLARRPRPHRLPHPPPAHRPRPEPVRAARRGPQAALRRRGGRARRARPHRRGGRRGLRLRGLAPQARLSPPPPRHRAGSTRPWHRGRMPTAASTP